MMQSSPGRESRERGIERTDRPRFRQDLFAEAVDEHGTRFIDVMDPDSGSVFRFFEVEYSLACGMDGERDVAGIVKWAQDELGLSPSQQEVRVVIATLGDLGFIDTGASEAAGGDASSSFGIEVDPTIQTPPPVTEPELGRSVVVGGPPARPAPAPDLELGAAGTATGPRREPARPAPALELGAPGAAARRAPEPAGEDVALGAPGGRSARPAAAPAAAARPDARSSRDTDDVSLDLSDHIAVRPDDVKEAVRASKVMSAVEPPREFAEPPRARPPVTAGRPAEPERSPPPRSADLPFSKPPERAVERAPERMAERPAAERAPERMGSAVNRAPERSFDSAVDPVKPAKAAEPARAVRPPVELPRAPAPAPIEAVPEAEEHKGTSAVLIVLVVIVLIAAAAFFVWKYVLDQHDAAVETPSATAPVQVAPPPAPAPPPPPAPATKVALETPPANEIKSVRAGAVETVLADKTSVKEGDVVLKFVGYQSIEAERTSLQRDQKRLQDLIDAANKKLAAAQSAGNKAAETASQTELTNRNNQLAAKQMAYTNKSAEFDKFMVYAAHAGTFAPQVKLRQKLAVDAVIGKIEHDPVPVAVFKVADPKPFAPQSSVELAIGKSEQHVSCTVADVQADSIKVGCPANPALTDGADVTLKVPGATSPPSEDAPAPAGAGSTAAPSEAAGSAAAPAAEPPSAGSAN